MGSSIEALLGSMARRCRLRFIGLVFSSSSHITGLVSKMSLYGTEVRGYLYKRLYRKSSAFPRWFFLDEIAPSLQDYFGNLFKTSTLWYDLVAIQLSLDEDELNFLVTFNHVEFSFAHEFPEYPQYNYLVVLNSSGRVISSTIRNVRGMSLRVYQEDRHSEAIPVRGGLEAWSHFLHLAQIRAGN